MRALLFLAAFIIVGCTEMRVISRNATSYPPKPDDCAAEILHFPPKEPFEELATVKMSGYDYNEEGMDEDLRWKTCQLGGDAVVVLGSQQELYGVSPQGIAYTGQTSTATIIRYKKKNK